MTDAGEALALVEAAFADAPRPDNSELLHPDCADDMDLEPLYYIPHWTEMTDEDVIGTYAAPSFLSPAGFRHFLAAYLRYALQNPDSPQACVSSIIWGLDPSVYDEALRAFVRSKFSLLDDAQRSAVIAFLEAMRSSTYGPDAERALKQWRESD